MFWIFSFIYFSCNIRCDHDMIDTYLSLLYICCNYCGPVCFEALNLLFLFLLTNTSLVLALYIEPKIIWCNAAQKCSNMPVKPPKSLSASVFLFNKSASASVFLFNKKCYNVFFTNGVRKNAKIRPKHWLNSGVVNKQHKLRHSNSGQEKFGSAHRRDKKKKRK